MTFSPTDLSGCVLWLNADDLAGSDSSAVASWTDRVSSRVVSQATGSKQPLLRTGANGLNSLNAVQFTSASSQVLTGSASGLPLQNNWTYILAVKSTSVTGNERYVSINAAAGGSHGYMMGLSGAGMQVSAPGVADWATKFGIPVNTLHLLAYQQASANGAVTYYKDNLQGGGPVTTSTTVPISGSDTLYIGGRATGVEYANMLVGEIIAYNRVLTTVELTQVSRYMAARYGLLLIGSPYYSTAAVTTPNGARSDAIEIGAVYRSAGIFGHKYWLGLAGDSGSAANENPSVNFSDDGNTWSQTGISNPVIAYPGGGAAGNNADPMLFDNTARDSKFYMYYVVENATTASNNGVFVTTSTDGLTWGAGTQVLSGAATSNWECPVVVYDAASSKYWLYTMNLTSHAIYRQTSSNPTGPWSSQTACTYTIPGSGSVNHIAAPVLVGTHWVMAITDRVSPANGWFMSSTDGLAWTVNDFPSIVSSPFLYDASTGVYRVALVDAGDNTNFLAWYTTSPSATSRMGTMITIPYSEAGVSAQSTVSASVSDTISISDSLARAETDPRTPADSIGISDGISRTGTDPRGPADTIPVTDSPVTIVTDLRAVSDTVPLSDSLAAAAAEPRALADTIPLSDTTDRGQTEPRQPSDIIPVSDTTLQQLAVARALEDLIAISDTVTGVRVVTVPVPPERTYRVLAENRIYRVPVEDRVYVVQPEVRVMEVTR